MPGVVAHDYRHDPRLLRNELARGRIDGVAERPCDVTHPLARLDAHVAPVVQRPRDGRDRDACALGDVPDRRAIGHAYTRARRAPGSSPPIVQARHVSPRSRLSQIWPSASPANTWPSAA